MVSPLLAGVGAVLLKNLTGWLKNSLEDGKIQTYEFKYLLVTTLQTGLLFVVGYYGLGMEEYASSGMAILGGIIWDKVDKGLINKKK